MVPHSYESTTMLKQKLRFNYLLRRSKVTPEQLQQSSLAIANNLLPLPIWGFRYYHIFLSITEKNEVDTGYILSILQGKDKQVVIPKTVAGSNLVNYLLTDGTRFEKNRWNIPEPVEGIEVPHEKIDLAFMPLLAFDRNGNRVGYGKGFYDNFIAGCRPDIIKVGLSLFEAGPDITDIRCEDVALNYCVTPLKVYEF